MTEIEKQALILFKDYTHLEIKTFLVVRKEEMKGYASGAVDDYEQTVLNQALEYHRMYTSYKLNQSKKKDGKEKS